MTSSPAWKEEVEERDRRYEEEQDDRENKRGGVRRAAAAAETSCLRQTVRRPEQVRTASDNVSLSEW
jgi:hypothetical protein